MKIKHDMHTHTVYSGRHHAKNTIEEMVQEAKRQGMEAITISDHGRSHPFYGIHKGDLKKMREEIDRLKIMYAPMKIYLAVEANLIGQDGTTDITDEEREYCDTVYAGYHYGFIPAGIKNMTKFFLPNLAARVVPGLKEKLIESNTDAYLKMIDRYPEISMITHPGDKMPINLVRLAEKAEEKNLILEINAHHDKLSAQDLKIAAPYNIRFAVNSDAHTCDQLGRTGNAEEAILESGIDPKRIINVDFD